MLLCFRWPSQQFFRLECRCFQPTGIEKSKEWSRAASLVWLRNRVLSSKWRPSRRHIFFFDPRGPCCLQCRWFPWRWKSATLIGHTLLETTKRLERPSKGKIRFFFCGSNWIINTIVEQEKHGFYIHIASSLAWKRTVLCPRLFSPQWFRWRRSKYVFLQLYLVMWTANIYV